MNDEKNSRSFCIIFCIFAQFFTLSIWLIKSMLSIAWTRLKLEERHDPHFWRTQVGLHLQKKLVICSQIDALSSVVATQRFFFHPEKIGGFHVVILTVRIFFKWVGEKPPSTLSCPFMPFIPVCTSVLGELTIRRILYDCQLDTSFSVASTLSRTPLSPSPVKVEDPRQNRANDEDPSESRQHCL